jgi:hypothetical protein
MVTTNDELVGSGARRETASLILNALVTRLSAALNRPGADHPMLNPTVFVPVRRGGDLTHEDVVARKV